MIILLYGQPASGKTTLSNKLKHTFTEDKIIQIDGDKWRDVTKNKDYSKEGRFRNLKGAFDMAIYLEKEGYTPILSFVTPYDELRKYLHDNCSELHEIYLFYSGDRGRNMNFASDFEAQNSRKYLALNTSTLEVDDCIGEIINYIKK
jgi:adenylylsulfate kinase-like enzyme